MLTSLVGIVGDRHVISDPETKAAYEVDWTRRFRGSALAVVRPGSTEEIVELVRLARSSRIGLVPQGGNTGLVGAATPSGGSIVVSMERMTDIDEVDLGEGTVDAGAGATLDSVDGAAGRDLFWPVSHAGASRATVGGSIATNAGGSLAWRYGTVRHHVRRLEAVLGNGTVVSRSHGFVKDNAGFDLAMLLFGSEGTLGIVTRATLVLRRRPRAMSAVLVALRDDDRLADLAAAARALPQILAAEVIFAAAMVNACEVLGLQPPLQGDHPAYVVLGFEGDPEVVAPLVADRDAVFDGRLWEYRERQNEAAAASGVPVKLDVSLPVAEMEDFEAEVTRAASASGCRAFVFGHILDGNLHVNLVGENAESLQERVVQLVVGHRGSIAAEHGIGRAKTAWLSLARSSDEIEAMRAIKRALDPDGILNPGVVLG